MQPSLQAFSARSFLDSTMSCDVTERYSPSTPSQYWQIKYGGLFCQVTATSAGSWKSVFGSLGFLNKDPQNQVLFNWSGLSELSRAATCIRRSMNFFLQLVPMNLYARSSQVTDCRRNPVNEETRQTCIYCQNMLRYKWEKSLRNIVQEKQQSGSWRKQRL